MLSSPEFGQRWGRHWLDLARYADSNGLDENFLFREAWRYRNWVIDSVNVDFPSMSLYGSRSRVTCCRLNRSSSAIVNGLLPVSW